MLAWLGGRLLWARRLFAVGEVNQDGHKYMLAAIGAQLNTDLRALVFLLLRFRRRTRFFLHFALILANGSLALSVCTTWGQRDEGILTCAWDEFAGCSGKAQG